MAPFSCTECDFKSYHGREPEEHTAASHWQRCTKYNYKGGAQDGLILHLDNSHAFSCTECDYKYDSNSDFKMHTRTHITCTES